MNNEEWKSHQLIQEMNQQMNSVHEQFAQRLGFQESIQKQSQGIARKLRSELTEETLNSLADFLAWIWKQGYNPTVLEAAIRKELHDGDS